MAKKKITRYIDPECGDSALYLDGVLILSGDDMEFGEFPLADLLKMLSISYKVKEVNTDWMEWCINEYYEWPEKEEDVVTAKKWEQPEEDE